MPKQKAEEKQVVFKTGNILAAEAALAAGCTFFAGYPITPSSEIAHVMAHRLPMIGGKFLQMEDEIAAMGAIIGASFAGNKVMTATSGPGFSLKQENIGYACMVEAPCVIVNVMRGGPSTGLPTSFGQSDIMQAKWGTHGDTPVIALTPAYLDEIYTETIRAFNLAEKFRTPVVILLDEVIGHMAEKVDIPNPSEYEVVDRVRPTCPPEEYGPFDSSESDVPPLADYFSGYRFHITGLNHDIKGFPTTDPDHVQAEERRMLGKINNHLDEIEKYVLTETDDAEILIVSFGSTARAAAVALRDARDRGIKVGMLRPITLWPFPDSTLREISMNAKRVVVPEANLGQLIFEVERLVSDKVEVVGVQKVGGIPIYPAEILEKIVEVN